VCSLNFRKSVIKKERYEIEQFLFLHFLTIVSANVNTLSASPVPLLEGIGEVRRLEGSHIPLPLLLEGLGGQSFASQPVFQLEEQEEVSGDEMEQMGWVLEDLEASGSQPILDDSSKWTASSVKSLGTHLAFIFERFRSS
jgi:hypothetical protein